MLLAKEGEDGALPGIPNPPDGGCACFVLRTGFTSAQGKLVRMIEGSQEKVKGHEVETALLLLLLFVFACASSGYVLKKGMENQDRSQYELLLHCILIITSVIPPELPMQTALAVNNSLMTLMKMQVRARARRRRMDVPVSNAAAVSNASFARHRFSAPSLSASPSLARSTRAFSTRPERSRRTNSSPSASSSRSRRRQTRNSRP